MGLARSEASSLSAKSLRRACALGEVSVSAAVAGAVVAISSMHPVAKRGHERDGRGLQQVLRAHCIP